MKMFADEEEIRAEMSLFASLFGPLENFAHFLLEAEVQRPHRRRGQPKVVPSRKLLHPTLGAPTGLPSGLNHGEAESAQASEGGRPPPDLPAGARRRNRWMDGELESSGVTSCCWSSGAA